MKKISTAFCLIIFLTTSNFVYGQELELIRNNSTKFIGKDKLIELQISSDFSGMDCENCRYQIVLGKIKTIGADSLGVGLLEFTDFSRKQETIWENKTQYKSIAQEMMVAKKDIFKLIDHDSPKVKKGKRNFFGLGGILLFTGLTSAGMNFFLPEKSNKKKALIYGGAQFGLGVVLMSLGAEKKYDLRTNNPKAWSLR